MAQATSGERPLGPGPRSRARRLAERASYEREVIYAILDEAFVCHLGICTEAGPVVIPTAYARSGDALFLHGAAANASLARGVEMGAVCVTVTLVDGLVLARSAFHHSVNYRSVVLFGHASEVQGVAEKRRAMLELVEHIVPGRSKDAREPTLAELRATTVVKVQIEEASAKARRGGPKDDPEDLALAVWAGELPLRLVPQEPVADPSGQASVPVPAYVSHYRRPGT